MKPFNEIIEALRKELSKYEIAYPNINNSWVLLEPSNESRPPLMFADDVQNNIKKLISDSYYKIWPYLE